MLFLRVFGRFLEKFSFFCEVYAGHNKEVIKTCGEKLFLLHLNGNFVCLGWYKFGSDPQDAGHLEFMRLSLNTGL